MANFFHTPKAKRFNLQPRYYDETAERRKEREARIIKELENEKKGISLTKGEMLNYIQLARKTKKKSNIRLLVILIVLLAIFYFFYL